MSKHDYHDLANECLSRLGEGKFTKAEILCAVDLPINQFTWAGLRGAFSEAGILCHYDKDGMWLLRFGRPRESAGAMEFWSRQVQRWCKNMRREFIGLIQATQDDAEAYIARLVDADVDPMTIYMIIEALDGALPPAVEHSMRDAYAAVLPDIPREMRERIEARLDRVGRFTAALLAPPDTNTQPEGQSPETGVVQHV